MSDRFPYPNSCTQHEVSTTYIWLVRTKIVVFVAFGTSSERPTPKDDKSLSDLGVKFRTSYKLYWHDPQVVFWTAVSWRPIRLDELKIKRTGTME